MQNIPEVKIGIVATSRSCFPSSLAERRREAIVKEYKGEIFDCKRLIIQEKDVSQALDELENAKVNALVIYLGNFGPETPETLLSSRFKGPKMFIAAAEGDGDLLDGRGDAYCGLLNASYNLQLRKEKVYIPENPVGNAKELAHEILDFIPIARTLLGLQGLKIITFGPRPDDFLACNAPIKALYDLGVAVEENSELDLLVAYHAHENDPRITEKVLEMKNELGMKNPYEGILPRLAQYELTLEDWMEEHKGLSKYVAFANKCWPAFQTEFRFVPCYVNSRLTGRGIPVSCEVDIYGALSEYIGTCISNQMTTLLDINNTVPESIYEEEIKGKFDYRLHETFMGFHCGNTNSALLRNPHMGYQKIMKRSLEPEREEPDITRGTMEGDIKESPITFYRLQSTASTSLKAYVAEGEVLPISCRSFGSIGIFAIKDMERFYRYVLLEKGFPHHGAVMFGHYGKAFYEVMKYLSIEDISYNQPASLPYNRENPFKKFER